MCRAKIPKCVFIAVVDLCLVRPQCDYYFPSNFLGVRYKRNCAACVTKFFCDTLLSRSTGSRRPRKQSNRAPDRRVRWRRPVGATDEDSARRITIQWPPSFIVLSPGHRLTQLSMIWTNAVAPSHGDDRRCDSCNAYYGTSK